MFAGVRFGGAPGLTLWQDGRFHLFAGVVFCRACNFVRLFRALI
jgi:hypothetical protein